MGGETETQTVKNINQRFNQSQDASSYANAIRNPYAPAAGALGGILGGIGGLGYQPTGAETGALNQLSMQGQAGNPFAGQISGVANTLLGGGGPDRTGLISDAYGQLQQNLAGTVGGQFLDPNTNPFFSQTTGAIADQVRDRLAGLYAGAGRDPAGAGGFGGELADQTAGALAPYYMQAYNTERGRQLDAANQLFGAGGQTAGMLSNLDQSRLGNMQAGIGAAQSATGANAQGAQQVLAAEAMRRGIPLETLAAQMGIVLPAASAFGTQSQIGRETGTTSGTQIGTETGTATQQQPWWQPVAGGLVGGVGLLGGMGAFGKGGWLNFGTP